MLTNAAIGAGGSLLMGNDPMKGALLGAAGGAIGQGMGGLFGKAAEGAQQIQGAEGALLSADEVTNAVDAYVQSGVPVADAYKYVDTATGNALGTAESIATGQAGSAGLQVANQAPFSAVTSPSPFDWLKANKGTLGTGALTALDMGSRQVQPQQAPSAGIMRGNFPQVNTDVFQLASVPKKKEQYSLI